MLQQAAFDDLIFKVDVMRNVASKHVQNEEAAETAKTPADQSNRWGSLPALNLVDNQEEAKSNEEGEQNGDEGLQEVRNSAALTDFKVKVKAIAGERDV